MNERKRKYEKIQLKIRGKNLPYSQLSNTELRRLCIYFFFKGGGGKMIRHHFQNLGVIYCLRCG